ncbi:hypothetical protein HN911_10610 [Candidatus Bathyarchaeota archaeon]|nr:hypothetical protein [Candidatus Bathyarchaeota archaeon]
MPNPPDDTLANVKNALLRTPRYEKTVLGNISDEGLDAILDRARRNKRYQRVREGFKV